MALTDKQIDLLRLLDDGPLTTRQVADATWRRLGTGHATHDEVHASMRRMENRELVRRVGTNPNKWELTSAGRRAIA